MAAVDDLLKANERYLAGFPGPRPKNPSLKLTIITCMDSRLDLFGALGLNIGEAHLIRNAGGIPTDDVLRSLAISQRALGTEEVVLIHHTDCGMEGFDDTAFRAQLESETGRAPTWDVRGFDDVRDDVRRSVEIVRGCPWVPNRDKVRGFVFDVASARVEAVD
ncbi:MAG: beta-class carbonic anhydrase [Jatrophihabitans sp.]|uniref:beta-class carbonic anhydrase n=1 Tax=Jatrophihabitans sp. TaxID=1932789 RepID=UPI003F7EB665